MEYRIEKDSMGELKVPVDALWGAQTQRAIENFSIANRPMPRAFIHALAIVKLACARANHSLNRLDERMLDSIEQSVQEVLDGLHNNQFPVDVYQTGSGTSSNMNMNEVLATLATQKFGQTVHPNDHINMGQSSNDTIPTTLQVSACLEIQEHLLPALAHLKQVVEDKGEALRDIVKTGRTHLMDAMPLTMKQELDAWAHQLALAQSRINHALTRLSALPQGGTAIGTGINSHPEFASRFCAALSQLTQFSFKPSDNLFTGISNQDSACEMSGQLKTLAVALTKISNDLRWMNSGPLAGLGEIALPALQPGSSIMPGKVNPVIPEATAMVCAQVIGNDTAITIGGQSGNFQLNVMLPIMADRLLDSIALLSNAMRALADKAIAGFTVNKPGLEKALSANPILVTALNSVIGYEKGAAIAKKAYATGKPVIEVALAETDLDEQQLQQLLNPEKLTGPQQDD